MPFPEPYPGLVIRFSYLWHQEHQKGAEEGIKDRPCAVVMVMVEDAGSEVLVMPITHTPPYDPFLAIEIPLKTRQRLGLDDDPCWVVCSELNQFCWPGPDLRRLPGTDRIAYGCLPGKLFEAIKERALFLARGKKLRAVKRVDV
mgnify:CR=1 FL=1